VRFAPNFNKIGPRTKFEGRRFRRSGFDALPTRRRNSIGFEPKTEVADLVGPSPPKAASVMRRQQIVDGGLAAVLEVGNRAGPRCGQPIRRSGAGALLLAGRSEHLAQAADRRELGGRRAAGEHVCDACDDRRDGRILVPETGSGSAGSVQELGIRRTQHGARGDRRLQRVMADRAIVTSRPQACAVAEAIREARVDRPGCPDGQPVRAGPAGGTRRAGGTGGTCRSSCSGMAGGTRRSGRTGRTRCSRRTSGAATASRTRGSGRAGRTGGTRCPRRASGAGTAGGTRGSSCTRRSSCAGTAGRARGSGCAGRTGGTRCSRRASGAGTAGGTRGTGCTCGSSCAGEATRTRGSGRAGRTRRAGIAAFTRE
jgi:hypothetical protein